jgi:hypothetical protein
LQAPWAALALDLLGRDQRPPALTVERRQRAERRPVGQIAQDIATLASGVFEVQQLDAMLALQQLPA